MNIRANNDPQIISSAAATALTSLFGDPFSFEDTTELEYGLPLRSFKSFYEGVVQGL